MESRRVRVRGVVQGVGFRPFVYRIAHEHGLAGFVRNLGDAGVEIVIRGQAAPLDAFLADLTRRAPTLSRLDQIEAERVEDEEICGFVIIPSGDSEGKTTGGELPPDVATCDACVEEILGASRFRGYWATSCTDCGPRFTVVASLPYDRPRTSMADFPMCADCEAEYTNPLDRRYHAQTTACPVCGPVLLFDDDEENAVDRAVLALREGQIVALKGLGGTHIACDATQDVVVHALRERLGRPTQPFAVMGREDALAEHVVLDKADLAVLRRSDRPIVVVPKRHGGTLPGVAPGLHTIGVMLPHAGLHHLLLAAVNFPLVMTSANRPGRPMLIENDRIVCELEGIVDHYLLHNRRVVARCDDSVKRRVAGRHVFLRRSRGFVPQGLARDLGEESVLALGPESDLTVALYDQSRLTISQHVGTVDDVETLAFLRQAVEHLVSIVRPRPVTTIACDAHPGFLTSRLAEELAAEFRARVVSVQHHVAHVLSLIMEHRVQQGMVGIVLDGYGYGVDGSAWGGEVFVAGEGRVERVGALCPVRLPGGDEAARRPLRMVASYLVSAGQPDASVTRALMERGMTESACDVLLKQIHRGVNAPWTTSAGRFLDAVSAWLGICTQRGYEGEPAMRLEAVAAQGRAHPLPMAWRPDGRMLRLDTPALFKELVDLSLRETVQDVAATAQQALAEGVAALAIEIARQRSLTVIGLSGGVTYNDHITSMIAKRCQAEGYQLLINELVPCGDGGVSAGQAAYAAGEWILAGATDDA